MAHRVYERAENGTLVFGRRYFVDHDNGDQLCFRIEGITSHSYIISRQDGRFEGVKNSLKWVDNLARSC